MRSAEALSRNTVVLGSVRVKQITTMSQVHSTRLPLSWDGMGRDGMRRDRMGREGLGFNTTSDRGPESTPQLGWFPVRVQTAICVLPPSSLQRYPVTYCSSMEISRYRREAPMCCVPFHSIEHPCPPEWHRLCLSGLCPPIHSRPRSSRPQCAIRCRARIVAPGPISLLPSSRSRLPTFACDLHSLAAPAGT